MPAGIAWAETPALVRDSQAPTAASRASMDSVVVDSALATLGGSKVVRLADPDLAAMRRARRDSTRAARQGLLDQPRLVMFRSLLVPGWGQLHNRAWLKAVLVAGGETKFVLELIDDDRKLKDLDAGVTAARLSGDLDAENRAVEGYNARLDHFVGRQWLLGALLVYSLVDAYVDAHFVNFQFEFDHDSARPSGVKIGMEKRF